MKADCAEIGLQGKVDQGRKGYEILLNEWITELVAQKSKRKLGNVRTLLAEYKRAAHDLSLKIYYMQTDTKFNSSYQSMWA